MFMEMVKEMRMDHSYKPVLLKAILTYADVSGKVKVSDLVDYFKKFYKSRRNNGLVIEKDDSVFSRESCSDKEIEREILSYPFRRFENMSMMSHTKTLGIVQIDCSVWKKLSPKDKEEIEEICNLKLEQYYKRITKTEANVEGE